MVATKKAPRVTVCKSRVVRPPLDFFTLKVLEFANLPRTFSGLRRALHVNSVAGGVPATTEAIKRLLKEKLLKQNGELFVTTPAGQQALTGG